MRTICLQIAWGYVILQHRDVYQDYEMPETSTFNLLMLPYHNPLIAHIQAT